MVEIQGQVAAGYESVRQLYERNMQTLVERNTQLCVYVGEHCVVDLWATAVADEGFSGDSLVNVFSSGKSLEAITLAMLVDRGLLDYNAPIADYWPEFAEQGKQSTTLADLMRHEAGLAGFDETLDPKDLTVEGLKENRVGAIIQRQPQRFRPGVGKQREYHAITRGWIANEVFRRVEPRGRSMGQFLREEVSTPLGMDVFIGLEDPELARVSDVTLLGFGYQFWQSLVPKRLGRKMELNLLQILAKFWRLRGGMKDRTTAGQPSPLAGMRKLSVFNSAAVSRAEIPSAGAKCSARGLAKLAAVLANGGALAGLQLLSEAAWAALHAEPIARDMMAMNTTFSQGGVASFPAAQPTDKPLDAGLNHGRQGYYGWMGLGGSIFQWHPEHKIGLAYVPTSLNVLDIVNERGKAYQAEVRRCVERLAAAG